MKVLVVGYAKTGTKTLYAALDILGYKAYDYEHNFYYLREQWAKILSQKGGSKEDFYEMYKDVDATMDMPACNFWEDIFEAFPDTKKAPKDQLLIFNPSEGWEPLCKFLGKPVPDCDFPHKNKGGNIADEKLAESPIYQQMKYEAATSISVLVCVFAIVMIYFLAF